MMENDDQSKARRIDIMNSLQRLKMEMEMVYEAAAIAAQIRKAKFDALVNVGFTEAQAMEIVKHHQIGDL